MATGAFAARARANCRSRMFSRWSHSRMVAWNAGKCVDPKAVVGTKDLLVVGVVFVALLPLLLPLSLSSTPRSHNNKTG